MSTAAVSARFSELATIVGDKHVTESITALADFRIENVTPAIAVTPGSVDEVAAILAYANQHDLVVVPAGGLTHQEIGRTPEKIDILLRMDRFNSIEHYDPGDLTIGVGAGATLGEIEAMLRDQGQMLPIDVAHSDRVTIGGAMATAAHGPLKHFYGGVREFCLGVRYVSGDGKIAKAGARVVKNVAGFDVMKLLAGSHGTLAVVTSASFKLFPAPAATQTFECRFANLEQATEFRDFVMNSPLSPMCLELFSPRALQNDGWTVALRAGGSERVLGRYASELGSRVTTKLEGSDEQKFWDDAHRLGEDAPVVLRVSVPLGASAQAVADAERIASEQQVGFAAWGRIGIGNLFFAFDGGMAESYVTVVGKIRQTLPRDASAVVLRCPTTLKPAIDVWGATPTHLASMAAVKRSMNPHDILNRGRFLL